MMIDKNTQRQFLIKASALKDALKKRPAFVAGFIGIILILFVVIPIAIINAVYLSNLYT